MTVMTGSSDRQRQEQRRRNVRTGLILASIAAAFFIGFIVKMRVLGG